MKFEKDLEQLLKKEIEGNYDLYEASCLSSMNQIIDEIYQIIMNSNKELLPFIKQRFSHIKKMNDLLDLSYEADLLDNFYERHKNFIH